LEPVEHIPAQDEPTAVIPAVIDTSVLPPTDSEIAVKIKEEPNDIVEVHVKEELDEEQKLWMESGAWIAYRQTR